ETSGPALLLIQRPAQQGAHLFQRNRLATELLCVLVRNTRPRNRLGVVALRLRIASLPIADVQPAHNISEQHPLQVAPLSSYPPLARCPEPRAPRRLSSRVRAERTPLVAPLQRRPQRLRPI